jgi:hypothetical protein
MTSGPFQPGVNRYTQGFGSSPENLEVPHFDSRAPTSTDILYPVGKWWNYIGNSLWYLLSQSSAGGTLTSNWIQIAGASGSINSILGTANEITATTAAGVTTLSIPSTFVAPGSIAATTTVTAGTGFTATTGNLTLSGTDSGLVTTPTVVTAGASPQTANGRIFEVTFSGVSIASGATQTFVVSNTAITGAGTVVSLTWFGTTAGSGLSIESVTASSSQLSIVMTNATSATMVTSVANITFVGIVLN